jgi:HSP20 family protein
MNAVEEKENTSKTVAEGLYAAPDVNIYENEQGFVVQAEMPGVTREGLEITLEGSTLRFTGRRAEVAAPGQMLYRESRAPHYRRAFELDPAIDTNRISAEMHQGLLTLNLPKAERAKPRKIEIK